MFSRRSFIVLAGAAAAASQQRSRAQTGARFFSLGIASGSPGPDSVILWTRLAPDPLNGGGMTPGRADVRVRVARDPAMRNVIRDDMVATTGAKAHSVHYKVEGLEPGREYWYQFSYDGEDTVIGRTRTTNPKDAEARIALAYCQSYEGGFYAAYRDMAEWLPDLVIHTGDYIYEGGIGKLGATMRDVGGGERRLFETVRLHNSSEIVSLFDYRNRYALYKSDPDLQAAHAAAPWIVAMDDHEIDNNWAGDLPQDPDKQTALEFKVRKLAAFQAYYEHMPIEAPPVISGVQSGLQMYGLYRLGPAQVHLLDTRQFRTNQPCGDGRKVSCEEALDPAQTMLGGDQEKWLFRELTRSNAPFNLIATQVWFTPYRYNAPPEAPQMNFDSWDGYPLARQRLSDVLAQGVRNPVFLTGDWHTAMASTVYQTPLDTRSKRIGHELVGASISSGCPWARDMEIMRDANPHVAHLNGNKRGYLRVTVKKDDCIGDFRVVEDVGRANSAVTSELEIHTKDI
ncbi:alkaline phosphatase [Hyphomonas neptunium ATCC 15444]|uniref:Alkaline phosphatase n=2 Tax=Hyphomonas TaxID=85 RepID=Q0BZE3_HYPNA|nr:MULTISPECIES: alkaline phosphatase D family protein [Hyphomonas]ABI78198.1 alkaline phosphatase [Hyphomonas neptunium ATCC 15444]KCZ95239.1 alkaline phosphatase [Hyphomonas hirschiana VP5]